MAVATGCSVAVIICAAGSSKRMGGTKKEFLPLVAPGTSPGVLTGNSLSDESSLPNRKALSVLGAAVAAFASCPQIGPIVITVACGEESAARSSLPQELLTEDGRIIFVEGGLTRRSSVHNALLRLELIKPLFVLIHDGARPWIKRELIERIIEAAKIYRAAIPALPIIETPKELNNVKEGKDGATGFIKRHLRRDFIYTAQTPQGFAFPEILRAHEKAGEMEKNEGLEYTDDAEVWGEFTGKVAVIPGDPQNRKITFPEDLNYFSEVFQYD